jgi:hypothetical protein
MQATLSHVVVEDCDLGWTNYVPANDLGYGIRVLANGSVSDVTIQRNKIHNTGEDAIQVGGAPDGLVIDRNEISYIATQDANLNPHADLIQLVGYGNTRITNNYMHHLGYPYEGSNPPSSYASGGMYVHGGNSGPLLFENNLIREGRNQAEFGDLGTGGCSFSNVTVRNNSIYNMFLAFGGGSDLHWGACSGSGNSLTANAIRYLGTPYGSGGSAISGNVTGGSVAYNADGECTAAACGGTVGYHKPSGVTW